MVLKKGNEQQTNRHKLKIKLRYKLVNKFNGIIHCHKNWDCKIMHAENWTKTAQRKYIHINLN